MRNTGPLYYDNEGERIKHQQQLTKKEPIHTFFEEEEDTEIVILNDECFPAFDNLDEGYPI